MTTDAVRILARLHRSLQAQRSELLQAAFQMEEILWELRQHATGLNVGRWDKIFSDIKVLKMHPDKIMADRASISLNRPWMKNYATLLIRICHRHGAFAMGGMAAYVDQITQLVTHSEDLSALQGSTEEEQFERVPA